VARYTRRNNLYPVALSILAASVALGVPKALIRGALKNSELKSYTPRTGIKRPRILTDDIVRWVRETWVQC
jgi:hypothetical protein